MDVLVIPNENQKLTEAPDSVMTEAGSLFDDELTEEIANIPDKLAFKIGDVADLLGVKQYVLRYWETEFEELSPKKSKTGQRAYTKKDVETTFLVRKLLYRDRFSIEGARAALKRLKKEVKHERNLQDVSQRIETAKEQIDDLVQDLEGLKKLFS